LTRPCRSLVLARSPNRHVAISKFRARINVAHDHADPKPNRPRPMNPSNPTNPSTPSRFQSQVFRLAGACALSLVFALTACGERETTTAAPQQDAAPAAEEALRQALHAQLDRYEAAMDGLIELLEESEDAARIEGATRELIELSLPLLEGMPALQPMCGDYLAAAAKVVDLLDSISEEEIEENYHQDGALPATSSALCYHVKDLLVHPATVIVLLREGGLESRREDMKAEILENRAHLGAVRASL